MSVYLHPSGISSVKNAIRQEFPRALLLAILIGTPAAAQPREAPSGKVGLAPTEAWTCPTTHPIKGNFTTYSGERCIYHVPGGQFYDKTKPERCYATENEARQDGCRRSKR